MLKNLSPLMTGNVLRAIDGMHPGDLIALVGGDYELERIGAPVIEIDDVGLETTVDAVFSVMPLSREGPPLYSWLNADADEDTADLAFAVNGLACDAEGRRVAMSSLNAKTFDALADYAVAVIRVRHTPANCGFLLRKGSCSWVESVTETETAGRTDAWQEYSRGPRVAERRRVEVVGREHELWLAAEDGTEAGSERYRAATGT